MTSTTQVTPNLSGPPEHATSQVQAAVPFCQKLASRLNSLRRSRHVRKRVFDPLPQPSRERLDASLNDAPIDTTKLAEPHFPSIKEKEKTVLYLAFGSNLCNETFRGVRGIRPLSQVNVQVPSLRLTFDLSGIPYSEPCFANSARRIPGAPLNSNDNQKTSDYHKDRWHKGLVGVVYEVTLSDYAHIIATEGGGSAYHDILVDCYVLPASDTVPASPTSKPFKAHTLFAPTVNSDGSAYPSDRVTRPDPSYAQPSARYLKLITDGAAECDLPAEYQRYLQEIRPYTITTRRQAVGKALFMSIWMPFIIFIFSLSRLLQDKKGRSPKWYSFLVAIVFKGMWVSYDGAFKNMFGDGERTIGDETMSRREGTESIWSDGEKEDLKECTVVLVDELGKDKSAMKGWSNQV